MSSTRTAPRTTTNSKTASLNIHHTNGSINSYDINDSTTNLNYPTGNPSEYDSNPQRSTLMRNVSQYDGIYRNARFIHAISSSLVGQQVVIQTSAHERFHGVLETLSPNADIVLTVSHRLDNNNNNDIITSPTLPIDLLDTIDSSSQTFELHRRIIKASNIVEIIAKDVDLSNSAKCLLDETPKTNQLEDERFSRMEHFYDSNEIDPETLEDLDLGDDGKAGFDPEDMFHTNREKFNTTTDFDESKYTNVPARQLSATELADIEKKVQEIERGGFTEDIDEDDAGVKRHPESHNPDDGNSNTRTNRSNRNEFRYDTEYNPAKRDNWREQRSSGNNNRRGGGAAGNNPKQTSYNSNNNRYQHNTHVARNHRYTENRPSFEVRDTTAQTTTNTTSEEPTRNQRLNSANVSQGQSLGPTSPPTAVAGRTIYSSTHRPSANRNSPAPFTGSSSSRNNSIPNTSSPPNQQSTTNKLAKKPSLPEQQSANDEFDQQPKQQRSSNNPPNAASVNRPTQLQSKQQASAANNSAPPPPPLSLPNQDENISSHDTMNSNNTGTTTPNSTKSNGGLNPEADEFVPVFSRESSSRPESRGGSTTSSVSLNNFNAPVYPPTLHLLPQQQQQVQSQPTPPIIPGTHPQTAAALYQQYYPPHFANMPQFINATPQQMALGVLGAPMIPVQPLIGTGPSTSSSNNGGSSGMTTPNSSVSGGPTYKVNNNNNNNSNQAHSGDNGNNVANSVPAKKAVVSVQRAEQSNVPQQQQQQQQQQPPQQQIIGATSMVYPTGPNRYYTPEYLSQQGAPGSMSLPQIPVYYQVNPSSLIQTTAGVGQPQNIMISPANATAGSMTPGAAPFHYSAVYPDPRMYSIYPPTVINPASVNPHWQLARSPPQQQQQQQQQTDPQRGYGNGQNMASQQTSSTGASNPSGGRPASTSGQNTAGNTSAPMTPQYTLNGAMPTGYAYGTPAGWVTTQQQIPLTQSNIPPQMNTPYNVIFDPSQQVPPQQSTYAHPNVYENQAYFSQQSQPQAQQQQQQTPLQQQQHQQQQATSQQGLDTVQQGNYNR